MQIKEVSLLSDKMSQSEIDNLLNALSSGEVGVEDIEEEKQKKVKKYDFRRPDKFAKEQLRTLEIVHENLGRLMGNFLSAYLRTTVEMSVISTESMIYSEFNNSISNPAIICVIDFSPLEGHVLMEIGSQLSFSMIDKVLGGSGKKPLPSENRAITEIEEVLIRGIVDQFSFHIREAWSNIIELMPNLEKIETNSQFAQLFSPSESIALITYNVKIGESEGLINIAIPHIVIEPILQNLSSRYWFVGAAKKNREDEYVETLKTSLNDSTLEIKTIVGRAELSVSELLSLGLGDVIVLGTDISSPLEVYVADELKYYGVPGVNKKSLAVKVTEVLDAEGHFIETDVGNYETIDDVDEYYENGGNVYGEYQTDESEYYAEDDYEDESVDEIGGE